MRMEKSPHSAAPVRLKFWGVRGSLPTPGPSTVFYGGNTSCVEVRAGGEIIILDAGTGLRPLGLALQDEFKGAPVRVTLVISHTHWDHIQGFPFFLPAYQAQNRVRVLGYEGAKKSLAATLAGQMEGSYFPVALDEMPGHIVIEELDGPEFSIGPVRCLSARMNHPGVTMGYRLFTAGGSIVYIPDNEPAWPARHHPASSREAFLEFIRGAEALICDAQYAADEYPAHAGWGHGCVDEVVGLAVAAEVRRLYLFHHDPGHDDAWIGRMLEHARRLSAGSPLRIEAAREGMEIPV
jgi:phosphoribosyl 1,2-cyclic phosphodiesterase